MFLCSLPNQYVCACANVIASFEPSTVWESSVKCCVAGQAQGETDEERQGARRAPGIHSQETSGNQLHEARGAGRRRVSL